jgi:hypothetical protein
MLEPHGYTTLAEESPGAKIIQILRPNHKEIQKTSDVADKVKAQVLAYADAHMKRLYPGLRQYISQRCFGVAFKTCSVQDVFDWSYLTSPAGIPLWKLEYKHFQRDMQTSNVNIHLEMAELGEDIARTVIRTEKRWNVKRPPVDYHIYTHASVEGECVQFVLLYPVAFSPVNSDSQEAAPSVPDKGVESDAAAV